MPSVLHEIGQVIVKEFSDLHDASQWTELLIRLLVAIALSGAIGYERESRQSAAGLRTHMLVGLGAAMFVLIPLQSGMTIVDMSRVLQGLIAGIGFLGAGAIIKIDKDRAIHGLTTAASLWLTAAVGVAAGMGREATAVTSAILALIILSFMRRFKDHADSDET
ncbi:MgtC/SapB family protein [Robbsia andropogonis]|uniref:MgtC/SapB family protein n=1 Tax=Robbsia andropogonis TaxID=28092 RepID=UPI00046500C1|nr:MgtC/SapB family protein [Robbsia andropogonis]MCP1119096.1 MgtC/SapB family protein [Robbsia andropogonis]MCP1129053.1 MgtC/SapB family protein [Robbsia andropogonis]